MKKQDIYIDFEGITTPFTAKLTKYNIFDSFPFAYSVGLYRNGKFYTKTYVHDFKKDGTEDIFTTLRTKIREHVRALLRDKKFNINSLNSRFIGYSTHYEYRILSRAFKKVEIFDISHGKQISLTNATSYKVKNNTYFPYFRSIIKEHPYYLRVTKNGRDISDGHLASWAGHLIATSELKEKSQFSDFRFNKRKLVRDLKLYSKDDVNRMQIINEDLETFLERANKVQKIIEEKSKAKTSISKLSSTLNYINTSKVETIKELKAKIRKEVRSLKKMAEQDHHLK